MAKGFKNGLKKVGRVWYFKFKHQGKVFHGSTRCESFSDASQWLREHRGQVSLHDVGLGDAPTVEKALDIYNRLNLTSCASSKANMSLNIRLWVIPVIGKVAVNKVTGTHLALVKDNYMANVHRSFKPDSTRTAREHTLGGAAKLLVDLRTLLNFCVKQGLIHSLAAKVPIPKVQKKAIQAMTGGEVMPFLEALDAESDDPQTQLAVRLMLYLGLRISEIITMRWNWFRPGFGTYTPGETKGREADGLPVHPDLIPRIEAWFQESEEYWKGKGHPRPQHVFYQDPKTRRRSRRKEINDRTFYYVRSYEFTVSAIKTAAANSGLIGSWSPHRLRSSCATILAEAGVAVTTIQAILRHKNVQTTLRYTRVTGAGLRDAMTLFGTQIKKIPT